MADKKFVPGIWINTPKEGRPDFVKFTLSILSKPLVEWLREQEHTDKGYLKGKIDILESKDGTKLYAAHNTFEAKAKQEPEPPPLAEPEPEPDNDQDRLPF